LEAIFNAKIKKQADEIVARYEQRRAAMLEVIRLLMDHYDHITPEIESAIAGYLEVPAVDVREIVTFYTLYYRKPRAKTRICVCRTLSCALRGSKEISAYLQEKLGIKPGEITKDGKFSLEEVECLGACEKAPMMQVSDDQYVGPLDKEKIDEIIKKK